MSESRRRAAAADVLSALFEDLAPAVAERTAEFKKMLGFVATTLAGSGFKVERVGDEVLRVDLPGGSTVAFVVEDGKLLVRRLRGNELVKQAEVPLAYRRHHAYPDIKLTGEEQVETFERHLVWEPAIDVIARIFVEVATE